MKHLSKSLLLLASIAMVNISHAKVESWYTYWAIGSANHIHPESSSVVFDNPNPIFRQFQFSFDGFGFYWPLPTQKTILGIANSSSTDILSNNAGTSTLSLTLSSFNLSGMHFFGTEPGEGFYLRAEAGLAVTNFDRTASGVVAASYESDVGLGTLVGAGYGIKVSEESRVLFGVSYARNTTPDSANNLDDTFSALRFTIGGLW